MDWFRSHHGAPTDPKWLLIAQKAGTKPADVAAVFWALLDYASQQSDRGSVAGFDYEAIACFFGLDPKRVVAIGNALVARGIISDKRVAKWEERQPKREDNSLQRVREHRERKRGVTHGNARLDKKRLDSEAKASGADGAEVKEVFDRALKFLPTRSLVGRLRKQYGDAAMLEAIFACEAEQPTDPPAFFIGCLKQRSQTNGRLTPAAGIYAGFAAALADLERGQGDQQPDSAVVIPLLGSGRA